MFGIGSTELLVILLVALVVLGPKSLPQIARTLGKALGEFRRVSTDFQRTLNTEVDLEEHDRRKKDAEKEFFSEEARAASKPQPAADVHTTVDVTANRVDGPKPDSTPSKASSEKGAA